MPHALIAGGGIGGLGAALALARAGHTAEIFERASAFREIGAGIQLGPNVFRMFDRLGIRAAMEADAVRPDALVMRCAIAGHEITRVPLGEGFLAHFGHPYAVTHRADMLNTLLAACRATPGITLHLNTGAASATPDGTLLLEDGRRIQGDLVIGADGLWSRIRAAVLDDGPPVVSGHIAYRAVLPMDEVPSHVSRTEVVLWAGPRLHLVHYPMRRGTLMNLVAVFHSDHYEEGWDATGDTSLITQHFAPTRPEVRDMLARIDAWKLWVLCDREPRRGWTQGRITLLGDAAHPMLQYLAQGANMALEDAVCLADQLALHADIPTALTAYEDARALRTARVQVMARVYGQFYHAADLTAELRDAALAGRTAQAAWAGMEWLYNPAPWPVA
jgi:3-hydroxybenzoate 6-monooxygenase